MAVRDGGGHELLVVNHGWRESVEVFEVLLDQARPHLRWIAQPKCLSPLSATMSQLSRGVALS